MRTSQNVEPSKEGPKLEVGHWTRNRLELFEWLCKTSRSTAELYQGAVELLFGQQVSGFSRFVSHAVREIRNRLPGIVSGTIPSGRLDYKGRIDDLSGHWKRARIETEVKPSDPGEPVSATPAQGVVLPRKLVRKIDRLIADHEAARQRPEETAIRLFEGVAPSNQKFRDRIRPVVVQWMEVCNWFMARTHEAGFTDDEIDLPEFTKNFELFESTLLAIVRGVSTFFDNTDELDAIIRERPTPERVEAAIARMGHGEFHRYFFEKLQSAEWIRPLVEKKFFSAPPAPIKDESEGTITFAAWPESRYLVRMARRDPEAVAEVVLRIPETQNTRVHDDLLDIALALPGVLAAKLVPRATGWIRGPYGIVFPQKMGALIAKLAEEREKTAALDLAATLLEVLPDPSPVLVPEPVGHVDAWLYEQILRKHVAVLVAVVGLPALDLLSDLLAEALRLSQKEADAGDFEDYSFVWRPAIEHGRGFSRGVTDALTSAVVDAALHLLTHDEASVPDVVLALEKRKWTLFHRISLHVLRLFADGAPDLAVQRLKHPSRYDFSGTAREFWSLAASHFHALSEDERKEILNWIDAGPNLEAYARGWQEFTGQPVTEKDATEYAKRWRRDRLAVLKDGLSEELTREYETLVTELGPPNELTEGRTVTGHGFAQLGPKEVADLRQMSVEEIVAYLKSWQPKSSANPFETERIAGLAANLGAAVAADPGRFSSAAQKFENIDPTYVRELLQALREPAKKTDTLDWKEVLALCQWAISQPRIIPGRTGGLFDRDAGWAWTRGAIVRLLATGFETDTVPFELRAEAWSVLAELAEDPDPTPEDEAQFLEQPNSDPQSLSMNTIRGQAMRGVVQYALWVRRRFEKSPHRDVLVDRGFEEMPEVRQTLDRHLDPGIDPSLTTRAVYGRWLPWLHFLDRRWFADSLHAIFPAGDSLKSLRDCVWTSYVVGCGPYNDTYRALEAQYVEATARIGTYTAAKSHLGDPDVHLGQHLLTFYWRGIIPSVSEPGPLGQFYASASDELRASMTGFIGRGLKNDPNDIPAEIIERLQTLFEMRLEAARQTGEDRCFQKELTEFGWWFVSKKSSDDWSMDQLLAVLKITRKIVPDLWVVELLAELSGSMPRKAVQCLGLIVEGDEKGWGILGWKDDARKLLAAALESEDATARQLARELVHRLGGRGYFEFRDLLSET